MSNTRRPVQGFGAEAPDEPDIPDNAPNILDLNAYVEEALGRRFEFVLGDRTWSMARLSDIDVIKVFPHIAAAERGDFGAILAIVQSAMTPEDWTEFQKEYLPMAAAEALFSTWQETSGVRPGESRASRRSSQRTARR